MIEVYNGKRVCMCVGMLHKVHLASNTLTVRFFMSGPSYP